MQIIETYLKQIYKVYINQQIEISVAKNDVENPQELMDIALNMMEKFLDHIPSEEFYELKELQEVIFGNIPHGSPIILMAYKKSLIKNEEIIAQKLLEKGYQIDKKEDISSVMKKPSGIFAM